MSKYIEATILMNRLDCLIKRPNATSDYLNGLADAKQQIELAQSEDVISTETVVSYLCGNRSNNMCDFCDTHLLSFCNEDSWNCDRKHCNDAARKMIRSWKK